MAKIALFSTRCGAIGDGRSPRLGRTVAHRAPRVAGGLRQEPSITKNCCTTSSKWKPRAQVAESCLKVRRADCVTNAPVPQGTTALSTPPFVRAGCGCRNNTTVLSRPEAAGWAPLVCAGPLTTLRGTVGQWPPATGQWWNERRGGDPKTDRATQMGGDPKTDQRKEELSKQLGCEGRGPENPGVVAPLIFCKLSRQLLALQLQVPSRHP